MKFKLKLYHVFNINQISQAIINGYGAKTNNTNNMILIDVRILASFTKFNVLAFECRSHFFMALNVPTAQFKGHDKKERIK